MYVKIYEYLYTNLITNLFVVVDDLNKKFLEIKKSLINDELNQTN